MSPLDFSTRRFLLPPARKECFPFVVAALLLTCALEAWLHSSVALMCGLLLTYGVYLFFRDPERVPPKDEKFVTSPADGFVCLVQKAPLPKELEASPEEVWRVSVFMSVLDVHVNRAPCSGTIVKDVYVPGAYINASLDKASEKNERHIYQMQTDDGRDIAFVQIAGLVARRIVSFVSPGTKLKRAERFGLIRFGSRVDVYLPSGVEPIVLPGQTMVAGETPIARL